MNYLFAGDAIAQHLKSSVLEFGEVLKAGELDNLIRKSQRKPSAFVVYQGDVVPSNVGAQGSLRRVQYVKQEWLVVISINLTDKRHLYEHSDALAGELIDKTLKALMGFKVNEHCKPLMRSSRRIRPEYVDGFGYFPLMFEFEFIHH